MKHKFLPLMLALAFPAAALAGNLKVYFLDVRQGDCTLIVTPGSNAVLIDCNSGYHAQPLNKLSSLSIQTLDYIIATHDDGDHAGGLDEVIGGFGFSRVKTCFDHGGTYSADWTTAASTKRRTINVGTNIVLDTDITLFCLAAGGKAYDPALPAPHVTGQLDTEDNGLSVVVLLKYKNIDIWIGGDATSPVENGCINAVNDPTVTGDGNISVLRADHHGSKFHTYAPFLSALNPLISIISSGGDAYGHPTQEVIDRLEAVNLFNYIYCTEAEGADGGTPSPGRGVRLGTFGDAVLDGNADLETDGNSVWVNGTLMISGGIASVICSPSSLQNNNRHKASVEAAVTVPADSVSNVALDWSSLGGPGNQKMYDDGTHGDRLADDLIFTFTNMATAVPPGSYIVAVTLTRTNGTGITNTGMIHVVEDTAAPLAENFSVRYTNGSLSFRWTNPPDVDLRSVRLRYLLNAGFPENTLAGTLLYSFTNTLPGQEYHLLYSGCQYYNRYYFSLFFTDYKDNVSRLDREILVVPLSGTEPVFLSDNLIKPDDKGEVEFLFDASVRIPPFPSVEIFNLSGMSIRNLDFPDPANIIRWDLTNEQGRRVGSGIYLALIRLPDRVLKKKILVVR